MAEPEAAARHSRDRARIPAQRTIDADGAPHARPQGAEQGRSPPGCPLPRGEQPPEGRRRHLCGRHGVAAPGPHGQSLPPKLAMHDA